MGNKTVKRLAILIGAAVLIGGGGYLLWSFQVDRMARSVVARAEKAESEGRYAEAERLYREHLAVVKEDAEVQRKYAEVLLKLEGNRRREEALGIFEDILRRYPGRDDVRRRAAEVASEIGGGATERARGHLASLLKNIPDDGHLEYLMARCCEQNGDPAGAVANYESAIEHGAPERLEAAQRRAMLLRDSLGRKDEADGAINAMVRSSPGDYRVYLGRGRYREAAVVRGKEKGKGGVDDFREAKKLAPDRPEIYLALAEAEDRGAGGGSAGLDRARQVLDEGLAALPKATELYQALAGLEQRAGRPDRAGEALELGLKALPDDLALRWLLALNLAGRGQSESGRLRLQIAEMERLGAARPVLQYLQGYEHFNRREFREAQRTLTTALQTSGGRLGGLKGEIYKLLARCYAETNSTEQQQEAAVRALSANPNDATARLGYIQSLAARGELDEAIRQYRELDTQQPGAARLPLASLLIDQVRRKPAATRDWREVERLIDDAAAAAPRAVEPALLRARMLMAQGHDAQADDLLETTRARSPEDPRPWVTQIEAQIRRGQYAEASAGLDRARKALGDRFELRAVGIALAAARGGPSAPAALDELGRGLEAFSRDERRRLLTAMAYERDRIHDAKGSVDAWERLAREDPENLQPRLRLFELAIEAGDADRAEARIRAIEPLDIEFARLCESHLLAWRARRDTDPAARRKLRDQARGLLNELRVRRPDMARVPLAMARLDEEEIADAGSDEARREKIESALASYRLALELGLHEPAAVRGYIQLLFRTGRGGEALKVYSEIPHASAYIGDLGRVASQYALTHRDYPQAEAIARKAVETDPADFQARVWLSRVLFEGGRGDEAVDVARRGVDAAPTDPARWITLVQLLTMAHRNDQAEKVAREAEGRLAATPIALAECSGVVGKAYELGDPDRARDWYRRARDWFDKAQAALKDPDDLSVRRQLAAFLLQTNEAAHAEGPLKEILARASGGKSPTLAAWARRGLAKVYVGASPPRIAEAMALYPAATTPGADPDDLRVLSRIHEIQGTPEGRRQAIADLEALIGQEAAATPEDRLRFAQLLEAVGDWTRAHEQFQELILRADAARDPETAGRRPTYYVLFVEALLRHHRPGEAADLAEARKLVAEARPIEREPLVPLLLEAEIDKADGRPADAAKRILAFGVRPDLTVVGRIRLAIEADRLGLYDAAEALYRRAADQPPPDPRDPPNRVRLALFLARRNRVKEAIDLCEQIWAEPTRRINAAQAVIQILCDPSRSLDLDQTHRVIAWFERGAAEDPRAMAYIVGLGNLYERLGDYPRAEDAYRRAIQINDSDGIASNNLAWLLALRGGRGREALALINKAINARGPLPEFLDTRGMIFIELGEGRRAVTDLEGALRTSPTPPKFFHLAQAYLGVHEKEKARRTLEAGKVRGLPTGLHVLEIAEYKKITGELGIP